MRELTFIYKTYPSSWDLYTAAVVLDLHAQGYDVAQNSDCSILVEDADWSRVCFLLLGYNTFSVQVSK